MSHIASVEDVPLHSTPIGARYWWACHYPERPGEYEYTMYDQRCDACMIAFDAASHMHQDGPVGVLDSEGRPKHESTVEAVMARYRAHKEGTTWPKT